MTSLQINFYEILAEGPGVARGKIKFEKKMVGKKILKKKLKFFLAYNTPRPSMSVHKKIQPNRSSCLAGYREHVYIYECLVLLYRSDERLVLCVIEETKRRHSHVNFG